MTGEARESFTGWLNLDLDSGRVVTLIETVQWSDRSAPKRKKQFDEVKDDAYNRNSKTGDRYCVTAWWEHAESTNTRERTTSRSSMVRQQSVLHVLSRRTASSFCTYTFGFDAVSLYASKNHFVAFDDDPLSHRQRKHPSGPRTARPCRSNRGRRRWLTNSV